MRLKRLGALGSALVLSISSLFIIALPGAAHALGTTLYWCNPAGGDFNTVTNWNTASDCSTGTQQVPATGDDLIFDNTNLTADATVNNDITGLDIDSITFQGANSSSYGYTITGDAISLDSGITESSSATVDQVEMDLTLTAPQTFSDTTGAGLGLAIGDLTFTQTLNLGSNTLTLDSGFGSSGGVVTINSQLIGSGDVVLNGATSGAYTFSAATSGFTGSTTIDNGYAYMFDPTVLGTGAISVANGAALNGEFAGATASLANPITVGGNGNVSLPGALVIDSGCPGPGNTGSCNEGGTVTLSGPLTLTANATVGGASTNGGTTVDVTGVEAGAFCLSSASGSGIKLEGNDGSCSSGSGGSGGTTSPSSDPSSTKVPKTPDTGLAAIKANPWSVLAVTLASSAVLFGLAYRVDSGRVKQLIRIK